MVDGPAPAARPGRALLVAAGAAALVFILWRVGWPAVRTQIAAVGPWFLLLALGYGVFQFAFAAAWAVVLPALGARLPLGTLFALYLAGDAANAIAPGGVAGEPLKLHLLRERMSARTALASLALHKHADLLSQCVFVLLGVAAALVSFPMPRAAQVAAAAGAILLGVLLVLFTWALWRGTFAPAVGLLRRWPRFAARLERAASGAQAVDAEIRRFHTEHRPTFALACGLGFAGWCGGLVETWAVLSLLGVGSGTTILAAFKTAFAIEALSMALNNAFLWVPGRIGTSEGVRVGVFLLLGLPAASGAAYALLRRARELVWIGAGLLVLLKHHVPLRGFDADAGPEAAR